MPDTDNDLNKALDEACKKIPLQVTVLNNGGELLTLLKCDIKNKLDIAKSLAVSLSEQLKNAKDESVKSKISIELKDLCSKGVAFIERCTRDKADFLSRLNKCDDSGKEPAAKLSEALDKCIKGLTERYQATAILMLDCVMACNHDPKTALNTLIHNLGNMNAELESRLSRYSSDHVNYLHTTTINSCYPVPEGNLYQPFISLISLPSSLNQVEDIPNSLKAKL